MLRSTRIVLLAVVFVNVALLALIAQERKEHEPLTEVAVINLLQGGVPPERVAALAREFGTSFQVSPAVERDLREAGATDPLIQTLREVAAKPAAPKPEPAVVPPILSIESTPGGAQVFVDDELIARTSTEGRLKISTLAPGKHRVRIALDGYRDDERTLDLAASSTTLVAVALQPAQVAPPPSPPKPVPTASVQAPRAYLGVSIQDLTPESAKAFAAPDTSGVLVVEVDPRGPAAAAGLKPGDIVRSFHGQAVKNAKELVSLVGADEPDREIGMEILREGSALRLQVRMATPPTEARFASFRVNQGPLAGLWFKELTEFWRKLLALPPNTPGVLVENIDPNSPAANLGIAAGDIIEEVNREKVSSPDNFRALAERPRGNVLLHLYRQGKDAQILIHGGR